MVTVTCKELGGGNCTTPITGDTLDELRRNLMNHGQKDHKEMLQKMTPQDQQNLLRKLESLYRAKAVAVQ